MYSGLLNILKPTGLTSSDAVVRIKRIFGQKKVGHMGTLDPMGAGVLIVGLGKSARLFDYFLNKDKEYYATFHFGVETDTLDSSGKVTSTTENIPKKSDIINQIKKMTGIIDQLPPKFSAKNINGVRAYDLARRGEDFQLSPKKVEVKSFEFVRQLDQFTYGFNIVCSGGTYIRSICRDLGYSLNSLASMTSIIRTRCGKFLIDRACTLEEIEEDKEKLLINPEDALDMEKLIIPVTQFFQLSNGVKLTADFPDGEYKVFCNSIFFGIGTVSNKILNIAVWLTNEDN